MKDNPHQWLQFARCKGMDTELFFTDESVKQMKAVCVECPVRKECFTEAMREEVGACRFGIRGGYTPDERRRLSKRRSKVAA